MASSSLSLLSISSPAAASASRCGPGTPTMGSSVRFRPMRVSATCATAERPPRTFSSHHIASPSSLYEVLGIRRGATCQEIKSAYRRLARVLHPDVAPASLGDSMGREFMRVHEAYETLSDPEKRSDYDREMLVGPRPSPVRAGSGFGGRMRKWETDQCW